jgi:hypothetical protein
MARRLRRMLPILGTYEELVRDVSQVPAAAGHSFTINLGDLPTWLAGIGTVGALAAALWQIRTERKLRLQREAQEREDHRREQARLVSAVVGPEDPTPGPWDPDGRTAIELINGSLEPVYRLVIAIVAVQGTMPRTIERTLEVKDRPRPITTASILPSGTHRVWISGRKWAMGSGFNRPGAEAAFTDRSGSHWIRRATGQLEELPEDPIDHFAKLGLPGPWDMQTPERIS